MLERYFIKPATVDRIRGSWIGEPIERYVTWLSDQGYAARNVYRRVPILVRFGEFAQAHGAQTWDQLPTHVTPFATAWVRDCGRDCATEREKETAAREVRNPIHQLLRLVLPDYAAATRRQTVKEPFSDRVPGFLAHLREERGLRETSINHYGHYLRRLEKYLGKIAVHDLGELSPAVLSAFVTDSSRSLSQNSLVGLCSALRVFLRYAYREKAVNRDLSGLIESPQHYRLADIPRSIPWDEVQRMLEIVDRRTPTGKRDYAILLLLVTYGLRGCEVAALTLDDIDWKQERLRIPERKAGHSTAYPLSPVVGEAILAYLQHGRPQTAARQVFFRVLAPRAPLTREAVSSRAAHYLHKAGIEVNRPGSHTLRHTCVQRLVDANLPLKNIGDYVGHSSAASTEVYAKIDVETLREVALGDGEDVL